MYLIDTLEDCCVYYDELENLKGLHSLFITDSVRKIEYQHYFYYLDSIKEYGQSILNKMEKRVEKESSFIYSYWIIKKK